MNEAARVLSLYIELQEGKRVKKQEYCNRMNCSTRTFDRDICVIRNTLHECFIPLELTYDNINKEYFIKKISIEG